MTISDPLILGVLIAACKTDAVVAAPPTSKSRTIDAARSELVLFGHVHMAKTGGTSLNGLMASRFERVCGIKGYSYDSYRANLRMAAGKVIDSISLAHPGWHRERVPHEVMDEIGFEDCDFISNEVPWSWWRRFEDWPFPLELHVPCRDPLEHLMSQCNYRRLNFDCVNASRSLDSLAWEVKRCRVSWKRFGWGLLSLNNTRIKCYNVADQFSHYLAHMDKILQRKRLPAKFIRWETNRPRNVSNECIWSAKLELKNDIVGYMRDNCAYYSFCHACLNQHANGTLSLLEPTMWGRWRRRRKRKEQRGTRSRNEGPYPSAQKLAEFPVQGPDARAVSAEARLPRRLHGLDPRIQA